MKEKILVLSEVTEAGFKARASGFPVSASSPDFEKLENKLLKSLNAYFHGLGVFLTAKDLVWR